MSPFLAPLLVVSALLGPALLLVPEQGSLWKRTRVMIHLLSIIGFAAAGSLFARDGEVWAGVGVLAGAFVWTGAFWLASIRRRLRRGGYGRAAAVPGEVIAHAIDANANGMGAHHAAPRAGLIASEDLDDQEQELLRRLLAMGDIRLLSIATPREEIVYADCTGGTAEILSQMHRSRHPRIPVVDGTLDRVVGVLHAKDLAPFVLEGKRSPALKGLMRRPLFVSQDRTVASLLELFRSQRSHLAVVVDSYSRTVGLITRADLFRYLSGGGEERAGG